VSPKEADEVLERLLKPNLMTLVGLALVVITFFSVLAWTSADQTVAVYVARSDIPARRQLTAEMVTRRDVDEDSLPVGAVRDADAVVGRYTVDAIYSGEVISVARLADASADSAEALSADLPANTRVLSVPADVSAALAGRIKAGDVVDVIAVVTQEGSSGRIATTLVQQALVLDTAPAEAALNASARGNETDGTGTAVTDTATGYLPGIYTLALSPEQAQMVALAASSGELYLSLNPVGGAEPFESEITTFDSLTESAGDLSPLAQSADDTGNGGDG
jgi:Flp pilus assembly protein CpaB